MAKKKRRKLTKAQAKAEAQRKKKQRQMIQTLVGIGATAAVVVIVLIAMLGGTSESDEPDGLEALLHESFPVRGADDAPVTIVELSDYNCSHCRNFALEVFPLIDEEFIASGQVKYVIWPYALWEESLPLVEAAACAHDQGGFWDFHHQLFARADDFSALQPPSRNWLRELAEVSELDVDEFVACLDQGSRLQDVQTFTEDAKTKLGVNSTPTILVNGVKTPASLDAVRSAIQAAGAGE